MAPKFRWLLPPLLLVLLWSAYIAADAEGDEQPVVVLSECDPTVHIRQRAPSFPLLLSDTGCVVASTSAELMVALKNSTAEEVWLTGSVSVAEFSSGNGIITISRSVLLRGVSDTAAIVGFELLPRGSLVLNGVWLAMEDLLVSGLWAVRRWPHYLGETTGIQVENEYGDDSPVAPASLWARNLANMPDGPGAETQRRAGVLLRHCVFEIPEAPDMLSVPDAGLAGTNYNVQSAVKYASLWRDSLGFNEDTGLNWPVPSIPLNNDHHSFYLLENALNHLRVADTLVRPSADMSRRMLLPGAPADLIAEEKLEAEASTQCQTHTGWEYTGEVNVTLSGRTCLPWSDFSIEGLQTANLPGNSCRNPSYNIYGVWCFVEVGPQDIGATGNFTWEFCDVPVCDGHQSTCTPQHESKTSWLKDDSSVLPWTITYNGTLDTSSDGNTCLPWNSDNLRFVYHNIGRYAGSNGCRLVAQPRYKDPGCFIYSADGEVEFSKCTSIADCPYDALDALDGHNPNLEVVTQVPDEGRPVDEEPNDTQALDESAVDDPLPPAVDNVPDATSPTSLPSIAGAAAGATVIALLSMYGVYVWARRRSTLVSNAYGINMDSLEEGKSRLADFSDVASSSTAPTVTLAMRESQFGKNIDSSQSGQQADWRETIHGSPDVMGLIKCHSVLGRGFTSTVWHATWRGSEVAAKAISLEHLPAEYREVALRGVELNVLGSLHHPHITHIYRVYCVVGESKDLPGHSNAASPDDILTDFYSLKHTKQVWIVMEMLHHGSLRTLPEGYVLGCSTTATIARSTGILLQLASALQYLHESGIVHGDLKRENVLLQPDAQRPGEFLIKLTDFGVSHQLRGAQAYEASAVFGDVVYMAPETFHDRLISTKMDIYSVGILMYELLAGDDLTSPQSANHLRVRELAVGWRPTVPADVPTCFRDIVHRCWHQDPAMRPTAAELETQLLEAMDAIPGGAAAAAQAALLAAQHVAEPEHMASATTNGYSALPIGGYARLAE